MDGDDQGPDIVVPPYAEYEVDSDGPDLVTFPDGYVGSAPPPIAFATEEVVIEDDDDQ